jgi:hypothetical protein
LRRQSQSPSLATLVVREDAPRDTVEPEAGLVPRWYVSSSAPGDEEGLCHDVRRVLRLFRSPQGVGKNVAAVVVVEPGEARFGYLA